MLRVTYIYYTCTTWSQIKIPTLNEMLKGITITILHSQYLATEKKVKVATPVDPYKTCVIGAAKLGPL